MVKYGQKERGKKGVFLFGRLGWPMREQPHIRCSVKTQIYKQ